MLKDLINPLLPTKLMKGSTALLVLSLTAINQGSLQIWPEILPILSLSQRQAQLLIALLAILLWACVSLVSVIWSHNKLSIELREIKKFMLPEQALAFGRELEAMRKSA